MSITHNYVSSKADPSDATLVGKTKWNDVHAITSLAPAFVTVAFNAGAPNIDASLGNTFQCTLTGTATFTISNRTAGQTITLIIIQDGTGGRLWTLPAAFLGEMEASGPAIAANAVITQSFVDNGTNLYAVAGGTIN